MTSIRVVGEDSLCCVLGERLVATALPRWRLGGESINARGVSNFAIALPRYVEQAQHVQAMLCIADTDGRCAVELRQLWLKRAVPRTFLLRLAVTEAESWVLADRQATSKFFGVALKHVPLQPDIEPDAKRTMLHLARLSKLRELREEMVSPTDPSKQGAGYNLHLDNLVRRNWQAARAAEHSDSLRRALRRLAELTT